MASKSYLTNTNEENVWKMVLTKHDSVIRLIFHSYKFLKCNLYIQPRFAATFLVEITFPVTREYKSKYKGFL